MDDTQLLRGIGTFPSDVFDRRYKTLRVKRSHLAMMERLATQSREGSKPSGADSTGETGADVCEARTPWRGHSAGVSSGKP